MDIPEYVRDEQLRNEALDMIESQGVIELMRSYGYDPDDTSGKDLNTIWNAIFSNRYGLMMNPTTDLHNLFKGFDSHWHGNDFDQKSLTYVGSSASSPLRCLGTEVNYYFQGVLFRIFGYSVTTGMGWVATWKKVSHHGAVTANIELFFKKGWKELPSIWPAALRQHRVNLTNEWRVGVRKACKKSQGK